MGAPVRIQVLNGLNKLFNLYGHNIYVSVQDVFVLTYSGLHDEEGLNINIGDPLTESHI